MEEIKMKPTEQENKKADARERLIHAPVEAVYEAFSNPKKLALWWGPKGFTNTFKEFDLRAGAYWRFTMHGPDKKDYANEICFLEVVENKKVVLEHFSGHHFILTIQFVSKGNNTLVKWEQDFDTVEHYKEIADFVAEANEQNLDRLTDVLNANH